MNMLQMVLLIAYAFTVLVMCVIDIWQAENILTCLFLALASLVCAKSLLFGFPNNREQRPKKLAGSHKDGENASAKKNTGGAEAAFPQAEKPTRATLSPPEQRQDPVSQTVFYPKAAAIVPGASQEGTGNPFEAGQSLCKAPEPEAAPAPVPARLSPGLPPNTAPMGCYEIANSAFSSSSLTLNQSSSGVFVAYQLGTEVYVYLASGLTGNAADLNCLNIEAVFELPSGMKALPPGKLRLETIAPARCQRQDSRLILLSKGTVRILQNTTI